MERVALFYMYLNLSNVCNNRDNWTLLSASTFNLLHYAFLVEVYEENWASQSFVFEKDMKSPLKGSWGFPTASDYALRTIALKAFVCVCDFSVCVYPVATTIVLKYGLSNCSRNNRDPLIFQIPFRVSRRG